MEKAAVTRKQIIAMTRETGRLVATNKAGVAPRSDKHVRRLDELKRKRAGKRENAGRIRA
jgi:hypothetical protein